MFRRVVLATVFVLSGFLAGLVLTGRMRTADETLANVPAAPPPAAVAPDQHAPAMPSGLPDLSGVAAHAIGSVTNIASRQTVRMPNSPFASDPLFRYFFGDQDEAFGYQNYTSQSLGSGVIVSKDGYILTNNHVVGDARASVSIVTGDKRELRAKVVGVDEWTDLAVLKIDAHDLPVLPWGDSSKLRVAEWVLAIGNPFQLNQTVTLGIVSALGRSLQGHLATYEDFIQTDAAINPGNSGGALVSARGELVGINTAIFTESGGYQGIGFAIPSNLARRVMDDLIKYGEVQRGTISGIQISALTSQLAEQLRAPNTRGALITRLSQRSDAADAGLQPGDIIVAFNGTAVDDPSQFLRMLSDAKIGSVAKIAVLRDGRRVDTSVPIVRSQARRR